MCEVASSELQSYTAVQRLTPKWRDFTGKKDCLHTSNSRHLDRFKLKKAFALV